MNLSPADIVLPLPVPTCEAETSSDNPKPSFADNEAALSRSTPPSEAAVPNRDLPSPSVARKPLHRLNNITDAFLVIDKDWRFTYVSEEVLHRTGFQMSQMLGQNIWELFPEARDTVAYAQLQRTMHERVTAEYELFLEPFEMWLHDKAYPTADGGLAIYSHEITERKRLEATRQNDFDQLEVRVHEHTQQLEQANAALLAEVEEHKKTEATLRQLSQQLEMSLNASSAGCWSWELSTNTVTWDDRNHEIYGFTAEQPRTYETWAKIVSPADLKHMQQRLDAALKSPGDNYWGPEFRVMHPTKGERWILVEGRFDRAADGKVTRLTGLTLDITERKRAAEQLREQQHYIENVLATAPNIIYVLDIQSGCFVYGTRASHPGLGYSQEEFIQFGNEFAQRLMHPDDQAQLQTLLYRWKTATDDDIIETELRLRHKNGDWVWHLVREKVFLRNANGRVQHIIGTAYDITERKQAREKLREQQRYIESILATAPNIIYVLDIQEQQFVYGSRGKHPGLNYSIDELKELGAGFAKQLLHPDDLDKAQASLPQWLTATDEDVFEHELRILSKDGQWVWQHIREKVFQRDASGRVKQIIGTAYDITRRKAAEMALRISEERLQRAIQAGAMFWWEFNLLTGQFVLADNAHQVLRETHLPETLFALFEKLHPDELDRAVAKVKLSFEENVPFLEDLRYFNSQEECIWVENRGLIVRDEQGTAIRVIGISKDISERKQNEAILQSAHDELETRVEQRTAQLARANAELQAKEAERQQLVRRLVTAQEEERQRLSLELHDQAAQQLVALRWQLKRLAKALPLQPQQLEQFDEIQTLAEKLNDDLHDLAWTLRPAGLSELGLAEALDQYLCQWSKLHEIEVAFDCQGDRQQRFCPLHEITVYRIVQEALTNIQKYAQADQVTITLAYLPNRLCATVTDNGVGFQPEKIAVPLDGTIHLGLQGMRERATLLDGTLTITSTPGQGTVLHLELPWTEPAATH